MADGCFSDGPVADRLGESSPILPVALAHLAAEEEHVALLAKPRTFQRLRRRDDLLDEGVDALFGLVGAEAELLGLCFHAGKFTSVEAVKWLAERRFRPLLFIPHTGGNRRS
jgi:hypothetical protein